ncbi:hypothetical protein MHN80_16040 [Gordonia McavH-238-E]|uniref:hypothetical protein n=1 Tax=Gordonia sp. McavH-238-E TaxID=2917736 RepID=UPI001EF422C2|nr:hypothetical protein [Gordonia sp. McavH-238-E]MCG7633826.1 hypothetical protein [Gordonia sp. McavH-238-E]
MTTRFDGRRRSRHDDLPLAGLPAWGLEMMMGLYGPETIRRVCVEEAELGVVAPPDGPSSRVTAPTLSPADTDRARSGAGSDGRGDEPVVFNQVDAELEAINSLIRYLGRKLRRR